MKAAEEINQYFNTLIEPKLSEMKKLHQTILPLIHDGKLSFEEGVDKDNKTIHNPTIGYGYHLINYANGTTKAFFQIGLSANATGISIYLMGIKDKTFLSKTYGATLGKAKITGYCIRFKSLKDIHWNSLEDAMKFCITSTEMK